MARSACALICLLGLAAASAAQEPSEEPFDRLQLRYLGPAGNRVIAVAGVPGDPLLYFAGSASGGLFRSTDGGVRWQPVFDDTGAFAIGSIAVAPSDPAVVWVGTGETFLRSNVTLGDGVYRSTDGGGTWSRRGLGESGRIGRIVVDPRDADVAWAAALGHAYGPQQERGVYRTRDGGATWERVLFVDERTGAIDLAMHPTNPRILYAATWEVRLWTAGRISGGPGSGLFKSTDGGDSWRRLEGSGLPHPPWGKIGLAVSADAPERVYALIETSSNSEFEPVDSFQGVLWRSDDGGSTWSLVSSDNTLTQRPLYYTRAVAAPDDADEVTFLAVQQSVSLDGGRTIRAQNAGWDHHDLWIDPLDPRRRISGHDGGISITLDGGQSWARPLLPNAQMYHVATDDRIPYRVYGNRQDGATAAGPSNSLTGEGIPVGAWRSVGGCEVGFSLPDRGDPDYVWSGCYDGILERFDWRSGLARDVSVWPLAIESWAAEDLDYRIQWTAPLALSPHDPQTVYFGSQFVHRTTDAGQSWELISPDLTTADPALMRRTGGLTLDDAGPTIAPVVFALAESPLAAGEIWAGTNDGQVQVTRDGGESWVNVTAHLPDVPPLGTIRNVEPSHHAAGRAYLVVDRHQEGDTTPYVLRTEDWGAGWTSLSAGLPRGVYGTAHCIREDPEVPGLLYLGTENALFVSLDDGVGWQRLGSGLPPTPVHWMEVQRRFGDLVVATYGRGFWVLDDLSAVRRVAQGLEAGPHLLAPRPAWRFRLQEAWWKEEYSAAAGDDPAYGALLHYRLEQPAEQVAVRVLAADGRAVRTMEELPGESGLHRAVWDLREEPTPEVELRTRPHERPDDALEEGGSRALSDGSRFSILAPPGRYRLELLIAGEVVDRADLEVLDDPHSRGGAEEIAAQMAVLRPLRDLIAAAAGTINQIEWLRRQLADVEAARRGAGLWEEESELATAMEQLAAALVELEGSYFDLRLTAAGQDTLRWQRRLYARLGDLARRIAKTDLPPTDQQVTVYELLGAEAARRSAAFEALLADDLPRLQRLLAASGAGPIAVPGPVWQEIGSRAAPGPQQPARRGSGTMR